MDVRRRSLSEIADVWDSRLRPDRCRDIYLMGYLGDLSLLAYGYDPADPGDDLELRGRDRDRVRLVKRISTSPEGIYLPTLVSECVKGQYIGQCERFDRSDPGYQFVYRFLNNFDRHDSQLIEKHQSGGMTMVTPTIRLLDLISEDIT